MAEPFWLKLTKTIHLKHTAGTRNSSQMVKLWLFKKQNKTKNLCHSQKEMLILPAPPIIVFLNIKFDLYPSAFHMWTPIN